MYTPVQERTGGGTSERKEKHRLWAQSPQNTEKQMEWSSRSWLLRKHINSNSELLYEQHGKHVEQNTLYKLSKLYRGNIKLSHPTKGYVNLTDMDLTADQEDLSNMGLKCHYLSKPHPHRKRLEIETLIDDTAASTKRKSDNNTRLTASSPRRSCLNSQFSPQQTLKQEPSHRHKTTQRKPWHCYLKSR